MFLSLRNYIPRIFTADEEVIAQAATLLPIAALFQMFDGIQGTISGKLFVC